MTSPIAAGAAAYANAAKVLSTAPPAAAGSSVAGTGEGFSSLLENALGSAIDTGKKADAVSLNALSGKADVTSVVTAVNNAELSLQTVLAVRDKVVSAYTEIMHMTL